MLIDVLHFGIVSARVYDRRMSPCPYMKVDLTFSDSG